MLRLWINRIVFALSLLFLVSFLSFAFLRVTPGDVCQLRMEGDVEPVPPDYIELCREQIGVNDPLIVQYWDFVYGYVMFDFGYSYWTGLPES